jgi:hypothetical protein
MPPMLTKDLYLHENGQTICRIGHGTVMISFNDISTQDGSRI